MNKWMKMAQEAIAALRAIAELHEVHIELQQTTNRLLAKILDQQSLAESRLLAMQDMQR